MSLSSLIKLERTHVGAPGLSKKRALELAAKLAAEAADSLDERELFDNLLARERLGTTAIGHGVAIPHGRIAGHDNVVGVLMKLADAIDFDAHDGQAVDILFALFVPESQCQQHLDTLAELAGVFSQPELLARLRACKDNLSLYETLQDWTLHHPAVTTP